MKSSNVVQSLVKRPLLLAIAASLAVGCATTQPVSAPSVASVPQNGVGPTGEDGAAGATGMPGGAMAGQAGERGATGATTAQGYSIAGPAGPMGRGGAMGMQGVADSIGAEGPMTLGPAGGTVAHGATGSTGAQGNAELRGVSGPVGAIEAAGPLGEVGPSGAEGPAGALEPVVGSSAWSPYRHYSFGTASDEILHADSGKAGEVSQYMRLNPSVNVGIDGWNERRVDSVRRALIDAGVPAGRIQTGAFGAPDQRRDGQVEVLVRN